MLSMILTVAASQWMVYKAYLLTKVAAAYMIRKDSINTLKHLYQCVQPCLGHMSPDIYIYIHI